MISQLTHELSCSLVALTLAHTNRSISDGQAIREYSEWKQTLSKIVAVVAANRLESTQLATSFARIGVQSCNRLLLVLKNSDFESEKSRALFNTLIVDSIRSLRLALRIGKPENNSLKTSSDDKQYDEFQWNSETKESQVLSQSLSSSALILGQCWLKNNKKIDMKWNKIIESVINIAINYLMEDKCQEFEHVLRQLGAPYERLVEEIHSSTTSPLIRRLIVDNFGDSIESIETTTKATIKLMPELDRLNSDSNIGLTLRWVRQMSDESAQKSFLLSSVHSIEEIAENRNDLSPNIVWNYLIDRNDCESLEVWVQKSFRDEYSDTEWPFGWAITQEMLESIGDNALATTRDALLSRLALRGMFATEEVNNFQSLLYRLGRNDCIVLNDTSNGFFRQSELIPNQSLEVKSFLKSLIEYCIDHKLNHFLFVYFKNFTEITVRFGQLFDFVGPNSDQMRRHAFK